MPSFTAIADRIGPFERPGISPRLKPTRLILVGFASAFVVPLALLIALFGPLSGVLAAIAFLVALVGTAFGRGPRVVAGALVLTGVLALWSEAQPSGGRVGYLVAGMVLVVGGLAIWTFDLVKERHASRLRWAVLVVGCAAIAILSPTLAFEAKVLALSPTMESEARRIMGEQPVAAIETPFCSGLAHGVTPRARPLGPFSFDCVFVTGSEDRPQVVFSSYHAMVYEDHARGTEFSGLVYAPAGPPLQSPVPWGEPYCLGHVIGDWYQFVEGSSWGAHSGCPTGQELTTSP